MPQILPALCALNCWETMFTFVYKIASDITFIAENLVMKAKISRI